MKKILFSIICIVGLGFLGYAQDKVLIEPDFSTFPPEESSGAVWTFINDADNTTTSYNWDRSGFPLVEGEGAGTDIDQDEWLISPSLVLDVANTYQVSFDYLTSTDGNGNVFMIVSNDNGATWVDGTGAYLNEEWDKVGAVPTDDTWTPSGIIDLSAYAGNTIKIAFVFVATNTDDYFAVDNILVEEDNGGGMAQFQYYRFESGIATATWTTLDDQAGSGSSMHFDDYFLAKVEMDPILGQHEWLISPKVYYPEVAYTDFTVSYTWYAKNNAGGSGAELYISNDDFNTWQTVDLSLAGTTTNTITSNSTTLANATYAGDSVQFAIVFQGASDADFFLVDFQFEEIFNEGPAAAASNAGITVAGLDSMMYPVFGKYEADLKEGFWKVQPDGWSIDTTYLGTIRRAGTGVDPHDYYVMMDTTGSDEGALDETLTSEAIAINIPSVGADYVLSFEWMNDADLNAGLNTDPNIPGVKYDFADIVVEISSNGTTWTEIWNEADEALLDATTIPDDNGIYTTGWTNYTNYLDNPKTWYRTEININQYITGSGNIWVRFNYTGDGALGGEFGLDNFYIIQTSNPDFEFEGTQPFTSNVNYLIDYNNIPLSQFNNPVTNLGALILNYGNATFPDGTLTTTVNGNTYGYETITDAGWGTLPETRLFNVSNRPVEYTDGIDFELGLYTFTYSLNIPGFTIDPAPNKAFTVSEKVFNKHDAYDGTSSIAIDNTISGAIGSVFEFKNDEVVEKVDVKIASFTDLSEIYMSVIQLTSPNATSGTVVYTSPRVILETGTNDYTFNFSDIELNGGSFYAFMFHQTDENVVNIATDDLFNGQVIRGNAGNLYYDADEEVDLFMDITIYPNNVPEFLTKFPSNKLVVKAGEAVNTTIEAFDADGDIITFPEELIDTLPSWLATWITFTDNGDGTLSITGTPTASDLGTLAVTLYATDDRNGESDPFEFDIVIVSDLAFFTPDYNADYRQFVQIDDALNTESTAHWSTTETTASILGDDSKEQEEWLISPPINLPAGTKAVATTYNLDFQWSVGTAAADSKYFLGGINGILGTEDADGGANYADVTLLLSTDNGKTWTDTLWMEDDPELVAPVTDGIFLDEKWGYLGGNTYNSVISLKKYIGETVTFAFVYESKNVVDEDQNAFDLGYFKVTENFPVFVDVFVHTDYTSIPTQHFDWETGLTFTSQFINRGQSIPDNSIYSFSLPKQGYYVEFPIDEAFFAASDTIYKEYTFIPDSGLINANYTFTTTLEIDNNDELGVNAADSKTINVANKLFKKDYSEDVAEYTLDQFDALGTVFELYTADYLDNIWIDFDTDGTQFSISIIKLATADATSGNLITTIDKNGVAFLTSDTDGVTVTPTDDPDIAENIMLEAGYYAIMVNQTTATTIYVMRSDRDHDQLGFVRGTHDDLYNLTDDKGYLNMHLNFETNVAPVFVASTITNDDVYQGQAYERIIRLTDANPYGNIFIETTTLPQWLTFTDNGDGTALIKGNAAAAEVGTHDVGLFAHDRFNTVTASFVITVNANPAPQFTSTPPATAHQGVLLTYAATGMDILGDAIVMDTVQLPASHWLGATISNGEILLSGTPGAGDVGNNVVKLSITDTYGNVSYQTFDMYVFANYVPVFISGPVKTGTMNMVYTYNVVAIDDNAEDVLTITAPTLPAWLTLTAGTNGKAVLSGTPTAGGEYDVELVATDAVGATATQSFKITVESNEAPVFSTNAVTTATEDVLYVYNIIATDADDDYMYFTGVTLPNWLTLTVTGNGTAILQGVPTQKYVNANAVSILVGDGNNTVLQSFTINVTEVNDAPVVKSAAIKKAEVGKEYNYIVEGWDEEGATLTYAAHLPEWLSLTETPDGKAIVSGTPTDENKGETLISLSVNDGNSTGEQVFNLSVTGAVGINSDANLAVEVYPNPTSGVFNLKNAEGADVYIFSNSGRMVKHLKNAASHEVIEISDLNAGSYFVKIVTNDRVLTKPLNLIK